MTISRMGQARKWFVGCIAAAGIDIAMATEFTEHRPILKASASIGDYRFRIYDIRFGMEGWTRHASDRLIISKDGRVVEKIENLFVSIDPRAIAASRKMPLIPLGTDITGDGEPNILIVAEEHGLTTFHIYAFVGGLRKVDDVRASFSNTRFLNLDDDPALEVVLSDTGFVYWYAPFAAMPSPRVALKFRNGRYRFAPELTRRPAIPEAVLRRQAQALRTSDWWGTSDLHPYDFNLWDIMLELIYTGHYDRARQFLDEGWRPDFPGKEKIRFEFFDCQLRRSKYWPDVAAMNGVPAVPPSPECPP